MPTSRGRCHTYNVTHNTLDIPPWPCDLVASAQPDPRTTRAKIAMTRGMCAVLTLAAEATACSPARHGRRRPVALSRSEQMARIRGRDTQPEVALRRALWAEGRRYRLHAAAPVGRPDIVFPSRRVAVFIDGCQWHGCPSHYVAPRSSVEFWAAKLSENTSRDRRQTLELEALGWTVLRVWEHEVFEKLRAVVERIARVLDGEAPSASYEPRVIRVEPTEPASRDERRTIEDLRDPTRHLIETRPRTTTKWKRPVARKD